MALIAMAVHDTEENERDKFTALTLESLLDTVDIDRHTFHIVVNTSTDKTRKALQAFQKKTQAAATYLEENVGTAKAINRAWKLRNPRQHCIKMDNDVEINSPGWVDILEGCITLDREIGIIGLKRKDCIETPFRTDAYKSELKMLQHEPGHPWRIVEKVNHVIGTCQMYNSALLDKIGYLYQPSLYGYDDSLAAIRCKVAGFYSCFYPHIEIDHERGADPEKSKYQTWKERSAGEVSAKYNQLKEAYLNGEKSLYCEADYD